MPGIAGIIKKGFNVENTTALQSMVNCMLHEKFYSSGMYVNERMGLQVGWVCHENSFSDCLPVWNETKDVCVIFSGEDFMEQSEIDNLRARGHLFEPGNANYLVHLYEEMGLKFIERLNGYFSGVLIDLREEKAVLFNDRYGLNRIYYHECEEGVFFSSEAKALLKVLPGLRKIDNRSLGEFFSCGCVLDNRTLFSGVSLLPGGSMWMFHPGQRARKGAYFKPDLWENSPQLSGTEYYERLKETFVRILPRYFRGQERVAVSLTGGIDTRMIMAWATCPPFKLPCYTFGGMYRDCADVKIARQVAKVSQQRHETIAIKNKFFTEFPSLAKKTVYYTDGAMDVSGAIELYVNRIARDIAPVRLTGNYGDQVVRSVVGFKPSSLYEGAFDPEFVRTVRTGDVNYAKATQDVRLSFFAFKQVPWHHYSRYAIERTQLTVRSPFLDNDLVALAYQAPPELATSIELSLRLIAEGDLALSRIPTDRGMLYRSIPVATKAQRLYQKLACKAEYAYDYGMPQWLVRLDHLFAPFHLEKIFLGRHKFYHFRLWYRNELSQYVKDILLDSRTRTRPYLQGNHLEEMVKSHIDGHRNYTEEIHRILTSELMQRQLIEMK